MTCRNALTGCEGGFTLVELLVALTILALMLGLSMNGLRFSVRTSKSVEASMLAAEETQLVQNALRRQIEQAVPEILQTEAGRDRLDFVGEPSLLEFIAPLRGARGTPGLHRIRIVVDDGGAFGDQVARLLMYYVPQAPDAVSGDAGEARMAVLLEGFDSAVFGYRSATDTGANNWSSRWRDPQRLPDLVSLRVEYPEDGSNFVPELVVAIKTTNRNQLLAREAT